MAIKINFDAAGNPEQPTIILAKKNGDKIGILNAVDIEVRDAMNDSDEMSFTVYKFDNEESSYLWNEVKDFRLVYCPEWEKWFEMKVELNESSDSKKTVTCTELAQAELSQIMLYTIEINTENDIARDEYDSDYPTVLYRVIEDATTSEMKKKYEDSSLLHRIMEKAPHYKVVYVDPTIRNIQRTFEFDDTSLYDAFQEIAEEINCIFVFGEPEQGKNYDGSVMRTISVYSLYSYCYDCEHRGEFTEVCSECGSENIEEGYGDDTTIFVTSDELADEIQLTTEADEVKNCFKLEAGDDLMTATIRNCNPNGTDYIWKISDDMKSEMSDELKDAIENYDEIYADAQVAGIEEIEQSDVDEFNTLVIGYNERFIEKPEDKFDTATVPIDGYSSLINAYYNATDFELFLTSSFMPTGGLADTTSKEQLKIVEDTLKLDNNLKDKAVAVSNIKSASLSTVNSSVLAMAKAVIDPRYDVEIYKHAEENDIYPILSELKEEIKYDEKGEPIKDENGNDAKFQYKIWTGSFKVSHSSYDEEEIEEMRKELNKNNISDSEKEELEKKIAEYETLSSSLIQVKVNGDYETFVKQKIDKSLAKSDVNDMSIAGLFELDINMQQDESGKNVLPDDPDKWHYSGEFRDELGKYCLNRLISFHDACQACIDIMTEQGITGDEGVVDSDTSDSDSENNDPTDSDEDTDTVGGSWNKEDIYAYLYVPYRYKLSALEEEIAEREAEIKVVTDFKEVIEKARNKIQDKLNFESYLKDKSPEGYDLWWEFSLFRREDKYSNDNYISDGLSNAKLISKANEFFKVAKNEIYKSSELQYAISTTLKNLLVIKKFKPIVNNFKTGNWIRVMVDDKVYKLRLIEYTVDYSDLNNISVEFADVVKNCSTEQKIQDILAQASSMATSYSSVKRQAEQGSNVVNNWLETGFDTTNVKIVGGSSSQSQIWDEKGMLFREYDSLSKSYSPTQLKIVNSTIAITDDNWETLKTAIGYYYYPDPNTGDLLSTYGVLADTIVGKLIIGEGLILSGKNDKMTFNDDGLTVVDNGDTNKVIISASDSSSFKIQVKDKNSGKYNNVFAIDDGNIIMTGNITATSLTLADDVEIESGHISGFKDVALTGLTIDLVDYDSFLKPRLDAIDTKLDQPFNSPSIGQYLSYNDSGVVWQSAEDGITSSGTTPVSGKAVYNYALSKTQSNDNANKLLYVESDGSISFKTKEQVKEWLGI